MKIIIIEDEHAGAELLSSSLKQVDNSIDIIGICEDEAQTLALLKSTPNVDAVFSDIQLTDCLSFGVLKKIDPKIPVIFVTAYNEYALDAFKHHGIDYVLKPFSRKDIEKAVEKLKTYKAGQQASGSGNVEELLNYLNQNQNYKNTFLVNFQDRLIPLNTKEIICFYTYDTEVFVLEKTAKSFRMNESLEQIEKQLNPKIFFRANRQYIVNKEYIEDIRHYFNGRLKLKLKERTPEDIVISKAKSSDFKAWLSL